MCENANASTIPVTFRLRKNPILPHREKDQCKKQYRIEQPVGHYEAPPTGQAHNPFSHT